MAKARKRGLALIKKSNDLIEARYKFDIWESRFFLSVLAQIHKDDEDFKVYRIKLRDVKQNFGINSNQAYDLLRSAARSLMQKPLYANYEKDGTKRGKEYHIIRSIDYLEEALTEESRRAMTEHEYIDVSIEPEMRPLLLQLRNQGGFTFYELNNVVKLGVYPLRVYELLKQYQSIGTRKLKIDELKVMFELTKEYPLFANFYQRVISPAIEEINKFTDLTISNVEKLKTGRKVTALQFSFAIKSDVEKERARERSKYHQMSLFDSESINDSGKVPEIESTPEDSLYTEYQKIVVKQFGVTPSIFITELKGKTKEQVDKAIRVTKAAMRQNAIKNVGGFFIASLRQDFTNEEEERRGVKTTKAQEAEKKMVVDKIRDNYALRKNTYFQKLYENLSPEEQIQIIEEMKNETSNPDYIKLYFSGKDSRLTKWGVLRAGELFAIKKGVTTENRQKKYIEDIQDFIALYGLSVSFSEEDEIIIN